MICLVISACDVLSADVSVVGEASSETAGKSLSKILLNSLLMAVLGTFVVLPGSPVAAGPLLDGVFGDTVGGLYGISRGGRGV